MSLTSDIYLSATAQWQRWTHGVAPHTGVRRTVLALSVSTVRNTKWATLSVDTPFHNTQAHRPVGMPCAP